MSKSCFFVVQGLHSLREEGAKAGPGVFGFRFGIPSVNLQGELREKLHVVNTGENRRVHIEGKFGAAEFFNTAVLLSKVLNDCAYRVAGGIEDDGDLDNIGSAKRGNAFLKGPEDFKGRSLVGMLFIREKVRDNCV